MNRSFECPTGPATGRAARVPLLLLVSLVAWVANGCASTSPGAEVDTGPVVATVNGEPIHEGEVDAWLKNDWFAGMSEDAVQLYQLRRAGLDGVIDDQLIAQAAREAGLDEDAYLERETAALGPVTDEEIERFYTRNRDRIQPPQPLEALRPRIRQFLESDRAVRVMNALREESAIEIVMTAPPPPPVVRRDVPPGGTSRGPSDAPITIVEFSDYQCPFCLRAEQTLKQVEALYPGQLRIVYRHLPLDFHPNAEPAARGAICAEAQGRFWAYHDLLFQNQNALEEPNLFAYAKQLELDEAAFRRCYEDPATAARVGADVTAARSLGASATPTFFINGRELRGAQPLEAFRAIIDQELEAARTP